MLNTYLRLTDRRAVTRANSVFSVVGDGCATSPLLAIGPEVNLEPMFIRIAVLSHLMGLFNNVGRKFKKTKRELMDGGQAEDVCTSCAKPVAEEYEHCPHCGEKTVEPVE